MTARAIGQFARWRRAVVLKCMQQHAAFDWLSATMMRTARLFLNMVRHVQKKTLVIAMASLSLLSVPALAVPPGTVISNTATASYGVGGVPGSSSTSNAADITTTLNYTPSTISFWQYSPSGIGATATLASPSSCAQGGATGPFVVQGNPAYPGGAVLNTATPLDLSPASSFHQGEPVFIRLLDANRNVSTAARDTIRATLGNTVTGDVEVVELSETGNNTGEFVGYLPTTGAAMVQYDCQLSITEASSITVTYTDAYDNTDTASAQALVDPFGIVFNSATGGTVDGATVSIVEAASGLPATVYGDDGISLFPATVTSGGTAMDSGGTTYTFPTGGYRFPFMVPGNYRINVTPPAGYSAPSVVSIPVLQTLPGAPFALDASASYGSNFALNAGPPLNVDLPVDPSGGSLFLTKQASRNRAGVGDFIRYTLTLTNNTAVVSSTNIIDDHLPRGLRYVKGSLHVNSSVQPDPAISNDGRSLTIGVGDIAASSSAVITYVATVVDDRERDAINTAQARNAAAQQSNGASATVTIERELLNQAAHVAGRVMLGNCPPEAPRTGFAELRLRSNVYGEKVEYTVDISGNTVTLDNLMLQVELPTNLEYLPNTLQAVQGGPVKPVLEGNTLSVALDQTSGNWKRQLVFGARIANKQQGTFNTIAELRFDSPAQAGMFVRASNSLVRHLARHESKSLVTLANYQKSRIDMNMADEIELETLIKEVKGKVIDRVRIMGHTDAMILSSELRTQYPDNHALSLARARSVASYLRRHLNISDDKIVLQGYGPDQPIAPNRLEKGRRANRRVDVEVVTLHGQPEMQSRLVRADSGPRRSVTHTRPNAMTAPVLGADLPGIEGIRIMMEDGSYAVTDANGLYHIEGLKPGTHVLQVDESTVPDHLEVQLCENNSRFAGSGHSRFIDVQGGTLWRGDFYLQRKPALKGGVQLRMTSGADNGGVVYRVKLAGKGFDYRNARLLVMLPGELAYLKGSSRLGKEAIADPEMAHGSLTYRLGDLAGEWERELSFHVGLAGINEAELVVKAVAMLQTADGKTHRTPVAENSLLHAVPEAREQQFIFRPRFSSANARLRQLDRVRLDRIIDQFHGETVTNIRVIGHADNQPLGGRIKRQYGDNTELSRARASSVADYLRQKLKLTDEQLQVVAMGARQPLADNRTEEGRALNRRVELYVETRRDYAAGKWKPVARKYEPRYTTAQYELHGEAVGKLQHIIELLRQQKIKRIRVVGHSDSKAVRDRLQKNIGDNYALSRERADQVANYLREQLGLDERQVEVRFVGPAQPIADNATAEGRALNRRVELFVEAVDRKELSNPTWRMVQGDSGAQLLNIEVARQARKEAPRMEAPVAHELNLDQYDLTFLASATPGVRWLAPVKEFNPAIPSTGIAIQHSPEHKVRLRLNGQPVSELNFEGLRKRKDSPVAVSVWRGVDLKTGSNEFVAEVLDANGRVVETLQHQLHYSDSPTRAEFVRTRSQLLADGRKPVVIGVRFRDREGYPARPGTAGTFALNAPYRARAYEEALKRNPVAGMAPDKPQFTVAGDGIALIELMPTSQSGEVQLRFRFNEGIEQELKVWLTPAQQDWVLVGLAEGTAGYKTLDGNIESLQADEQEDGLYTDGRLAFYAKGSVKGEWLLTAAYDSKRDEEDPEAVLHGLIDPNKYYTLYGDASERRQDAPSRKKLYVKLERQQFYALFGDFETGLTVTELSRYSRGLTGLQSRYESDRFSVNVFAAETDQAFVKDELRGDGTSGLYRLSRQNIVWGSEQVRVEVRDRFRSHIVLSSQRLARFLDYNIDPVAGTLYFKQPIMSRDDNLNPIYIVVDYEMRGTGDKAITAGGRGAVKFMEGRVEAGATVIDEGVEGAEGQLTGIDVRVKVDQHSEVRAEVADSEQMVAGTERSGSAWLAEYKRHDENIDARVYMREQEAGFGLGQQMGSETATRKAGADASYRATKHVTLGGEAWREDNLSTDAQRDVVAGRVEYRQPQYSLWGGLRQARDEYTDGTELQSRLLQLGASRELFNGKVGVRADSDIALGDENEANPEYPSRLRLGVDYRFSDATRLFLEQEYTQGPAQDTEATRVGIETRPWKRATVRSGVTNEASEYGPRTYASVGLAQGWQVSDALLLDAAVDHSKTIRDPGNTPFNVNVPPAHGTVDNDYTAVSVGATYRQALWSATARVEQRDAEQEDKQTLLLGVYRELSPGVAFSARALVFDTETAAGAENDSREAELSLAYRPQTSRWMVLNKLKWVDARNLTTAEEQINRKLINNLNANWLINRQNQLALFWGVKQVNDSFDTLDYSGITHALGMEYRRDLGSRWDMGVRGASLMQTEAGTRYYSYGLSLGYSVIKNTWISVGYNFEGFDDKDFSGAGYSAAGPYVRFRLSFDQYTRREFMAWWERDRTTEPGAVPGPR